MFGCMKDPLFQRKKNTDYKHENTGAGLSYSGKNGQWSFTYCASAYSKIINLCFVSDQTSEAGNGVCCYEFHARSGLKFILWIQKDALTVPTGALGSGFYRSPTSEQPSEGRTRGTYSYRRCCPMMKMFCLSKLEEAPRCWNFAV